jgi:hypothetical protein
MKTITVSCHANDPAVYGLPKYDNAAAWNRAGKKTPNGVSAYRWLRKTSPASADLTEAAQALVSILPDHVAGKMPAFAHSRRVVCYSGETEAEFLRRTQPGEYTEKKIFAFSLDKMPMKIDDWLFPQIRSGESDSHYWNRVVEEMQRAGVRSVRVGDKQIDL